MEAMYFAILAVPIFFVVIARLNEMESKLARLENKLNQLGTKLGIEAFGTPVLSDTVKQFLRDNPWKQSLAINMARAETGCSRTEAKEALEAYMKSQNQ